MLKAKAPKPRSLGFKCDSSVAGIVGQEEGPETKALKRLSAPRREIFERSGLPVQELSFIWQAESSQEEDMIRFLQ